MTPTEHWTTVFLVAVGIAATVPVGLRLLAPAHRSGRAETAAAIAAVVSLVIGPGALATALALPWLAVAVGSIVRARPTSIGALRTFGIGDVLHVLTLGWWANAALWLLAHRAGLEPLGFDRPITLFTVAHFHHAGFGLTAMLLAAHRRLPRMKITTVVAALHQIGMVTVAAGLTFSHHLEVIGAVTITVALAGWAGMAIGPLRTGATERLERLLFAVSAAAWVVPMLLAVGWAARPFMARPIVTTFDTMLRFHGAINAIGLVLAGLVAFALTERPDPATRDLRSPETTQREEQPC